jgi:hypothetical protein
VLSLAWLSISLPPLLLLLLLLLLQDVEGYEPSVIRTAQTLLSTGAIDNIVLEYSPGVYERSSRCVVKLVV